MGRRWHWVVGLVVLLAGPVGAKPVLQVWMDALKDNRPPAVVVKGGPIDAAWAVDPLAGVRLPPRLVEPGPAAVPQRGEIVHLVLYNQADAAAWPEPFLKTLPWDLRAVPADQVIVYCKPLGKDPEKPPWQFVAVAPNLKWLKRAYELLLQAEAIDFKTGVALAFRIVPTLLVTGSQALGEEWLGRQEEKRSCFEVRQVSAAELRPEDLVGVKQLAVFLTWQEWHETLTPEVRDKLLPLLPAALRQAMAGPPRDIDILIEAVEEADGGQRVAAVLAPHERWHQLALAPPATQRIVAPPAMALDSFQTALRRLRLVDLRRVQGTLVVPLVADPVLQATGEQLAAGVASQLGSGCQLEVIDDQVTGQIVGRLVRDSNWEEVQAELKKRPLVDLLAVVRTLSMTSSTTYAEAAPVCLTPDPGPYNVYEPVKPLASNYKKGTENPKYWEDLHEWEERHAEWKRLKAERDEYRAHAIVRWEQYLVETQMVRLAGQVDLYDRSGKLMRSWPILQSAVSPTTRTERSELRGFFVTPPALRLPPARAEAPQTLAQEAVRMFPSKLPEMVKVACLLPGDPILKRDIQTLPPPEGSRLVAVTGVGSLAKGLPTGRLEAQQDAIRQAVEQQLGVYLSSETQVDGYQLKVDRVRTKARGYGRVQRTIQEVADEQQVSLQCEVAVFPAELRRMLLEEGLLRQWRTMVAVRLADGEQRRDCPAAATALQREVLAAGLPVIDQVQSQELAERQAQDLEAAVQGRAGGAADRAAALQQARALRLSYGAQVLVTGLATVHDTPPDGAVRTAKADLTVSAINLYTAEVIASESKVVAGAEATPELARQAAVSAAAREAGAVIADRLLQARGVPLTRLELTVSGLPSVSTAKVLKDALTANPWLESVRDLGYQGGLQKWEVELAEAADKETAATWLAATEALPGYQVEVDRSNPSVLQARAVAVATTTPDPEQEKAQGEVAAAVMEAAEAAARAAQVEYDRGVEFRRPQPFDGALPPALRGNQVLVPLKSVVAWLGGRITPDPVLRLLRVTWTGQEREHVLLLPSGKPQAQVDGGPWLTWPVAPTVLNGTLYVPLEALAAACQLALDRPVEEGQTRLQLTSWTGERRYWLPPPLAKAPPAKPSKPPATKPRR